jgi:hypothetical protein
MPMAKDHGSSVKNDKQYEGLRKKGMSKSRAAAIASSEVSSSRGGKKSGSGSASKSSSEQGGTTQQKKAAGRKGGKATQTSPSDRPGFDECSLRVEVCAVRLGDERPEALTDERQTPPSSRARAMTATRWPSTRRTSRCSTSWASTATPCSWATTGAARSASTGRAGTPTGGRDRVHGDNRAPVHLGGLRRDRRAGSAPGAHPPARSSCSRTTTSWRASCRSRSCAS